MYEKSVVIIEDDEITALNLKISLNKQGYDVLATFNDFEKAKQQMSEYKPDIIIIDISLQKKDDGIELAKIIKTKYNIPFIYLTSYSGDEIISQAKTTEPYGYIVKPFNPSSLHATIQMALFKFELENKRKENVTSLQIDNLNLEQLLSDRKHSDKPIVHFGKEYYIDIEACESYYNNQKIRLTKKENAFLKLLVAQLGSVVSFEQAMNYVWNENGATENSIRTLVWRLRNKLQTDVIKNASGIGYYIEE
jgi:DNA-binding response OmpR family regulator